MAMATKFRRPDLPPLDALSSGETREDRQQEARAEVASEQAFGQDRRKAEQSEPDNEDVRCGRVRS